LSQALRRFDGPVTCASFARFLRINPFSADPAYVFWLLQYLYNSRHLLQFNTQHTGVSRFQFTVFANTFQFNLPSLSNQRRIGSILSAYDELIALNSRRIAILEAMARHLFDEWFVKLRFPGSDAASGSRQWSEIRLRDLVEDIRDAVLPSQVSPDTAYVGLEHMPRRSTTLISIGRTGEVASTKLKFRSGDILFGKIRPYFHKVVFAPFFGVTSSDSMVMRPRSTPLGLLALSLVSSDEFVAHAVQTSNGTKMPRANWHVLKDYPVAMPPASVLSQFGEIVGPAVELCAKLAAMNLALAAARDLLLPKLIVGAINLSGAEGEVERAPDRAAAE
jgi:type I restriction enzyme S subunit